jgi:regulatory protein
VEKNDTTIIRRTALNLLARRDHSQSELKNKLTAKRYPANLIDAVINDLHQAGLINEQRYTENFIRFRRNKGFGPERIALELHAKGIAEETIAEHLQITDNAWLVEARRVWQKHFKGIMPTQLNDRAKQIRFLQYRGFSREHIHKVLRGEDNIHDS